MKNLYISLMSLVVSLTMINLINAQGVKINSVHLVTKAGFVNVTGSIQNNGTISGQNATLQLSGNWQNTGTFNPMTSTLLFNGSGNQTLFKSGGESVQNLNIQKSSGALQLNANLNVGGILNFLSGNLQTQTNTLFLGSLASLSGEGTGHYVIGTLVSSRSVGTGASTLGNIGFSMSSGADDIGTVSVSRLSGSGAAISVGAFSGINRKWTVASTSAPASGRDLTFSWVSDDDNGKTLTAAQIWKSTDNGLSWKKAGSPQNASVTHSVTLTGETGFGIYTISDASNPLGCELICPSDINVNNTPGQCGAVVTFTPGSNGGCLSIAATPASGTFFNVGQTTVVVSASDALGNTQSCSFTVTVTDNENPTITCPQNITANMDQGSCYATVTLGTPATNDNCLVSSVTSNKPANNQYPFGVTTVTWTVTDNHGHSVTCLQTVTVSDNQSPTISCPTNISANMDANSCYATVNLGTPNTGDNCQVSTVVSNKPANDQYPFGVTTVTWTVTDNHNNSTTCLQTVTVSDNQNPTITCPANITANMDQGSCFATVALGTPVTGDNCLVSSTVSNKPANNQYPFGTTTVIWTVTDNHGNTASCAQTVTVNDNQAPTITCPSDVTANMDAGSCFATVSLGNPTTGDNCEVSSTISNKPANNQFPFGTTTVIWTVTDNHGNTASCSQTVTVSDNQPPTITCPANITANMDQGSCFATVSLGTPNTGDNCQVGSVSNNKPSNDQYPFGVTTVIWTVTDNHNNSTTCLQTVTVSDNQNPTITCPANLTVNMDQGSCFATVAILGTPVTSDNCLVSTVVNNKPANNQYGFGVNTVIWTVTDNHGRTSSCAQTITVNDNQAPTISCPSNVTANMDAGSCYATVSLGNPVTGDNCTVSSVISNKPVNDQYPFGETIVFWTVTDNHGNTSSCTQTVTVSDNQPPTIACPMNVTANMDQGSCFATVTLGTPITGDNCQVSSVSNNKPANNQYPFGVTSVLWTVTDNHGNTASCLQTVTVNDNQPPVITCPTNITANMDQGSCFATVILANPSTGDNCQVSSVSNNKPVNNQYPYGTTTVIWTVTDNHNNTSSCAQTVTVNDNQPPVVVCPSDLTLNIDQGKCYATQLLQSPSITENCQVLSVVNNAPVSNQYPLGTTLITWTVTDNHGNVTSCVQQIKVMDNEAPVLVCPANVGVCANPGNNPVIVSGIAPVTAWDRCSPIITTYGITGVTTATGVNDASGTSFNVGISTVKYTVVDSYGNTSTCSFTVTIYALPVVSFNNVYAPIALCEPQFQLTGGTPSGGVYSGPGVINNQFKANSAGPGTHEITYVYTDIHGCFSSTSFLITVLEPVNTTFTVGNGGNFPNLTGQGGLFNYLNTTNTSGNITAQVISNLDEPGTFALNPLTVLNDCWNFTVTIVPSAAVLREITGNTAQALIRYNGADRVTFDGTVFGGKHFLIRNNDNAQPLVQLSNGASLNVFKGCIFEGANSNAASGLLELSTSTGVSGNSYNNIRQNVFRKRADYAGLPVNMIYSSGTAAWANIANLLNNNEFINFGSSAIHVTATGNGHNWEVNNNQLYYTISPYPSGNQIAINFVPGSGSVGHVLNFNYFGGTSPFAGGSAWENSAAGTMIGIRITTGGSSLSGNTISNILLSNAGLAHFTGIETNGTGTASISNTVISNITVAGTGNFTGIDCKATGTTDVVASIIQGITYTATTGTPTIKGIQFKKGNADNNQIYNINCTKANLTPVIYGISNMASGLSLPNQITNNRIAIDAGISSKPKVFGLYDQSIGIGADFVHNTVCLSGATTTAYFTSAFYRIGNGVVRVYNNILVNRRVSNSMAKHYAINCNSTLNYTGNYNDLFTASASIGNWGGTNHGSFMTWKAMTAQDLNSININPVFVSATDLHLTPANSGIDNKGTPLFFVAYDIDASPRSLTTPDMGADEFSSILPRIEDPELLIAEEPVLTVYPNPSTSNTNIDIILLSETNILVEMYNIVGERVLVLANGTHIAGKHNFTLNAGQLPAGTYLIRFVASNIHLVKRLEIIR